MDELAFPNNETWVEPPPLTYDDIVDIQHYWIQTDAYFQEHKQFNVIHFQPSAYAIKNNLDNRNGRLPNKNLCTQYHGIKLWAYLIVRYESANPLDIPFNSFEPFLHASHVILYDRNQSTQNPQYNTHVRKLKTITEGLLAANAKYIREQSGLVLSGILYLNIHWIRYAPLSGFSMVSSSEISSKQNGNN